MAKPIAGAAATIATGKAAARVRIPSASRRLIITSGEDSSMTGSSVHADIVQSDSQTHAGEGGHQRRRQQHGPECQRCQPTLGLRRPGHVPDGGADGTRGKVDDDEGDRDIADAAGEIAAYRPQGRNERARAVHDHGIRERREIVGDKPGCMRRERQRADRHGHPRRCGPEVGGAARDRRARQARARSAGTPTSIFHTLTPPPRARRARRRAGAGSRTSAGTTASSPPTAASAPC